MNHVLDPRAALVRSLPLNQPETGTGNGRETGRKVRREIGTETENRSLDLSNTSGWTRRTLDAKHVTKNDVERK
jgi:hypothetical protein